MSCITELKEDIEVKKKHLQSSGDACKDIMLAGEDGLMTPHQIADVFTKPLSRRNPRNVGRSKENVSRRD